MNWFEAVVDRNAQTLRGFHGSIFATYSTGFYMIDIEGRAEESPPRLSFSFNFVHR